jgi:hypothetical protein
MRTDVLETALRSPLVVVLEQVGVKIYDHLCGVRRQHLGKGHGNSPVTGDRHQSTVVGTHCQVIVPAIRDSAAEKRTHGFLVWDRLRRRPKRIDGVVQVVNGGPLSQRRKCCVGGGGTHEPLEGPDALIHLVREPTSPLGPLSNSSGKVGTSDWPLRNIR